MQVPSVPKRTWILTGAAGTGIFLALAILRILFTINLSAMLIVSYLLLMVPVIWCLRISQQLRLVWLSRRLLHR